MNETLREDFIEAIEEAEEEAKPIIDKMQKFVDDHPWIPWVSNGLLGVGIYHLGKKAGVKKVVKRLTGNEMVTAGEFNGQIDKIFEAAASILDYADGLSTLVKKASIVKK